MGDTYSWTIASGVWGAANNWSDLTTGQNPAASAPGIDDVATISPTFGNSDLITGPISGGTVTLVHNVLLAGTVNAGMLYFSRFIGTGQGGITAGSVVNVGTLVVDDVVAANGNGAQVTAGTLIVSGGGTLSATNGATIKAGAATLNSGTLVIDALSSVEIGSFGGGTVGVLTVDAGATLAVAQHNQFPHSAIRGSVELNGVISGDSLAITGDVNGVGQLLLSGSSSLSGAVFAGGVTLVGADATLALGTPTAVFAPIGGLVPGDVLQLGQSGVTGLAYTQGNGSGQLAVLGGGATLETLTLTGTYDPWRFLLVPLPGAAEIVYSTNAVMAPAGASAQTTVTDPYQWIPVTGGQYNTAANWTDTFKQAVATVPPNSSTVVYVHSPTDSFQTIIGNGRAAAMLFTGNTALNGVFTTATLYVGYSPTFKASTDTIVLTPGSNLQAQAAEFDGTLDLDSSIFGGGATPVLFGAINLVGGSAATMSGLTALPGSTISVDAGSSMTVGASTAAVAGALSIAASATAYLPSLLVGNLADNGQVFINAGSNVITGVASGTGRLYVVAGGTLAMLGGSTNSTVFQIGPAPGGTIALSTGVTNAADFVFSSGGALTLNAEVTQIAFSGLNYTFYGPSGSIVERLQILSQAGAALPLPGPADAAGDATTLIAFAAGTVQSGVPPLNPSAGAAADTYTWSATAGGTWNAAADWMDYTAGQSPAAVAPGAPNVVVFGLTNQSNTLFQVVSGSGVALDTYVDTNFAFSGGFALGALTVQQTETTVPQLSVTGKATVPQFSGTMDVVAGSNVTASSVALGGGAGLFVNGGYLAVAGTLTMSGSLGVYLNSPNFDATLSATGGAQVVLGGLVSTSESPADTIYVDSTSTVEVGNAGGGVAGALNIDAGVSASVSYFSVDGNLLNNGTISVASTGTLLVNGTLSGGGTIQLGDHASIVVTGGGMTSTGHEVAQDDLGNFEMIGHATIPGGGNNGTIILGTNDAVNINQFQGSLGGFRVGDTLAAASNVTSAVWSNGTLDELANGTLVAQVLLPGDFANSSFVVTVPDGSLSGGVITLAATSVACFAAGTRVRTDRGERAVESLAAGDRVLSAFGGYVPVVWLGHRRVDVVRHLHPEAVRPVRIRAGAFAPGIPWRDLQLSPDHAVFVDDMLVPARCLINGRSIVRETVKAITYFHVELPTHDVIFAEGLACESYLDTGNRGAFAEAGQVVAMHPDFAQRVWEGEACAPQITHGPMLAALHARLDARADAMTAGHRGSRLASGDC